jgi:hypothetical protein
MYGFRLYLDGVVWRRRMTSLCRCEAVVGELGSFGGLELGKVGKPCSPELG